MGVYFKQKILSNIFGSFRKPFPWYQRWEFRRKECFVLFPIFLQHYSMYRIGWEKPFCTRFGDDNNKIVLQNQLAHVENWLLHKLLVVTLLKFIVPQVACCHTLTTDCSTSCQLSDFSNWLLHRLPVVTLHCSKSRQFSCFSQWLFHKMPVVTFGNDFSTSCPLSHFSNWLLTSWQLSHILVVQLYIDIRQTLAIDCSTIYQLPQVASCHT
jgi:hypothetical protein